MCGDVISNFGTSNGRIKLLFKHPSERDSMAKFLFCCIEKSFLLFAEPRPDILLLITDLFCGLVDLSRDTKLNTFEIFDRIPK